MDPNTLAIVAAPIYATMLARHGLSISDEDKQELQRMAMDDAMMLVATAQRAAMALGTAPARRHGVRGTGKARAPRPAAISQPTIESQSVDLRRFLQQA